VACLNKQKTLNARLSNILINFYLITFFCLVKISFDIDIKNRRVNPLSNIFFCVVLIKLPKKVLSLEDFVPFR
jgi:hypothetical protein